MSLVWKPLILRHRIADHALPIINVLRLSGACRSELAYQLLTRISGQKKRGHVTYKHLQDAKTDYCEGLRAGIGLMLGTNALQMFAVCMPSSGFLALKQSYVSCRYS